jgi:hypothetical protein
MRIKIGDPSIKWAAFRPSSDKKQVIVIEDGVSRFIGITTEEIAEIEILGKPALHRIQRLESEEWQNIRSETIVFHESFRPYSHLHISGGDRISITYQGDVVVGEKRSPDTDAVPIAHKLENEVFDYHSVEMVIRILPLAEGYEADIPIFHAVLGKEMIVGFRVLGLEDLWVADFQTLTWKVQTDWNGSLQEYWIGDETRELLKQSSLHAENSRLEFVRE